MRRFGLLTVMSLFIVGLFATVAYAAVITCSPDVRDCEGTPNDDTIIPTNRTATDQGTDRVFARAGDDYVKPSSGREQMFGGGGDDDLYGGRQKDKIFGETGNDYIVGGEGEDQLDGGAGNDVIVAGEDKESDEVNCGPGVDIAFLSQNDHSSLSREDCEEIVTFKSFEQVAEVSYEFFIEQGFSPEEADVVGEAGDPSDPAPDPNDQTP